MPDARSGDKDNLIACLNLIESQLRQIVFELRDRFREEFRDSFPGPWEEVQRRFELARKQIRNDELDWHYVEGVGLPDLNLFGRGAFSRRQAGREFCGGF